MGCELDSSEALMTLFRVLCIFLLQFSFIGLMFFARDITKSTIISVYLKYNDDNVVRVSSVGTATRYGLDGPGIESRWRGARDFPQTSRLGMGSTQPLMHCVPGLSRG